MLHRIKQFTALDGAEKQLFIEAYITLGLIRFAIITVHFKRLVASLEHRQFHAKAVTLTEKECFIAQNVGRAIIRAASHTPWESACLVQALAAQRMLNKRKVPGRFYLGVAKDESVAESMQAHAWLQCGDAIITGGGGHEEFTVVSVFSWK
jgi:hypothetical protein